MPTVDAAPRDDVEPAPQMRAAAHLLAAGCGGVAALIGALVLAGWAADIAILKSVVPAWVAMQPWTAVGLILSGAALILGVRGWPGPQAVLAGLAALLAASTLFQSLTGVTLPGVDGALFPERVARQDVAFPGRMAETSAMEFLLFTAGVMLCRWPRMERVCSAIASLGLLVAVTGVVGYLFGAQRLGQFGSYTTLAVHAGGGFALLFLGFLAAHSSRNWLSEVLSPRTGGAMARRLVPVVVIFPLVVGVLVIQVGMALDTQPAFRMAVAMVLVMSGLMLSTVWIARTLNAADREAEAARRAVRQVEARLRAVVDTAVDAMVVIDDGGKVLSFNQAAERIFGYGADEAVGRDVAFLMPEPDRSRHGAYIDAYKRTGMGKIIGIGREVEGLRKDGTTVPIELSIAEWADGGRRFFTGIMRDITQRLEAEQALAASEARFRAIFQQAAVGIELVDLDGRLLEVNQKLCALLGSRREDLLGVSFGSFTDPADLAVERLLLDEMLLGRRESYMVEKRYRRPDGRHVWVRVTSSLLRRPDGTPECRIALIEDLRQQMAAMEALRDTASKLEFALEGANAGMWDWDPASGAMTGTMGMYHMAGLDPAMPASREYFQTALLPEDRVGNDLAVESVLKARSPEFRTEYRIRHPTAGVRWIASIGRVTYGEDGSPLRMAGINIDITDLKRAEEQARAAQEDAERANRDKSRFLAAASHDLRQPVQALVLFTSALAQRLKGHPAAMVVHSMQSSLDALQALLDGLLDVSRLDAGVILPQRRPITLGEVTGRIAAEYGLRAQEHGLDLRHVGCGARVVSDPALLERILRNLIENAIRYTERGRILVGARRRGTHVALQVIDTGIGIGEEDRDAIFQEFYQVGNPERDRAKGLGLGLSIVRRLTRLLGHSLLLSSKPGIGTCFSLLLPLAPPDALPSAEPPAQAERGEAAGECDGLILVIDDEAMIRLGLTTLLQDWGWEVAAASDADEAIAWIRGNRRCPEVIIADYRLRGERMGTDAVREIKAACGQDIPAVIVTGDTAPERITEVTRGGFDIAHKPVAPERLRQMVGDMCRRGSGAAL